MPYYLCIGGEGNWAYSVELEAGESYRIGRAADNDIVVKDPRVSSYHCRIAHEAGTWTAYDLNSRNGMIHNEKRVRRTDLAEGDVIALGDTTLRFVTKLDSEFLKGKSILSPKLSQPLMRTGVQKLRDMIAELRNCEKQLSSGKLLTGEVVVIGRSLGSIASRLEDTESRIRALEALNAFHEIFHYAPTPASVYHEALQFLCSAIEAENAAIVLLSKSGDFRVPSTVGLTVSGWPRQVPERFRRLLADTVAEGRSLYLPSMMSDPHFLRGKRPDETTGDQRSIVIVPIPVPQGAPLGVLYFDNPSRPGRLTAKSVDLVAGCADVLGGFLSGAAAQRSDTSSPREAAAAAQPAEQHNTLF